MEVMERAVRLGHRFLDITEPTALQSSRETCVGAIATDLAAFGS